MPQKCLHVAHCVATPYNANGFAVGGALTGTLAGFCLGKFVPGYCQFVFSVRRDQAFNPIEVGIGQGLTQGLIGGVIVGVVLVAVVALVQRTPATTEQDVIRLFPRGWPRGLSDCGTSAAPARPVG